MFSLSGKSKNQIPCFPCAVATLSYRHNPLQTTITNVMEPTNNLQICYKSQKTSNFVHNQKSSRKTFFM